MPSPRHHARPSLRHAPVSYFFGCNHPKTTPSRTIRHNQHGVGSSIHLRCGCQAQCLLHHGDIHRRSRAQRWCIKANRSMRGSGHKILGVLYRDCREFTAHVFGFSATCHYFRQWFYKSQPRESGSATTVGFPESACSRILMLKGGPPRGNPLRNHGTFSAPPVPKIASA